MSEFTDYWKPITRNELTSDKYTVTVRATASNLRDLRVGFVTGTPQKLPMTPMLSFLFWVDGETFRYTVDGTEYCLNGSKPVDFVCSDGAMSAPVSENVVRIVVVGRRAEIYANDVQIGVIEHDILFSATSIYVDFFKTVCTSCAITRFSVSIPISPYAWAALGVSAGTVLVAGIAAAISNKK